MGILNVFLSFIIMGSGTTAFPLLRISYGPRACAMGESFTALSDDATSIFWNPGGLGNLKNSEMFFTHHEWFQDIRDENLILVLKTHRGTIGTSLFASTVDNIESRGSDQRIREEVSLSSGIFSFSYGDILFQKFSLGVTFKGFYDNLGEITGRGWGIDLGGMYRLNPMFNFGLNLYNLGPRMNYEREKFAIPSGVRAGVCISPKIPALFLMDVNIPRNDRLEFHTGGEYWINDVLAIRAGYRNGPQDIDLGGFTYGAGLRWQRYGFDYAYVPYKKLGSTHRISLKMLFPPIKGKTTLLIKVIDKEHKTPLEANLNLTGIVSIAATTDSLKGEYKISEIPPGNTYIVVSKKGYHTAYDSAYIAESESKKKVIEVTRIAPGMLNGYVFDAETKAPVIAFLKCDTVGVKTDEDGGYSVELPPGIHRIEVIPNDTSYIKRREGVSLTEGGVTEKNFYLLRKKKLLIFGNIYFETAKANILKEAHPILDNIGKTLQDNPRLGLTIAGHTDSRKISVPEFRDNWELSKARAEAIKDYLIKNFGIEADRLKAEGYGYTKPIVPNDSPENMAKNRRVEFRIMED